MTMRNYRMGRSYKSDYLIHSSGAWKEHKYVARTGEPGDYSYTYKQSDDPDAVFDDYFYKKYYNKNDATEDEDTTYEAANQMATDFGALVEGGHNNEQEIIDEAREQLSVIKKHGSKDDIAAAQNMVDAAVNAVSKKDKTKGSSLKSQMAKEYTGAASNETGKSTSNKTSSGKSSKKSSGSSKKSSGGKGRKGSGSSKKGSGKSTKSSAKAASGSKASTAKSTGGGKSTAGKNKSGSGSSGGSAGGSSKYSSGTFNKHFLPNRDKVGSAADDYSYEAANQLDTDFDGLINGGAKDTNGILEEAGQQMAMIEYVGNKDDVSASKSMASEFLNSVDSSTRSDYERRLSDAKNKELNRLRTTRFNPNSASHSDRDMRYSVDPNKKLYSNYEIEHLQDIRHYGVLGMKWGQHKAVGYYRDTQQHRRNKAVSKLRARKKTGEISGKEFRAGRKKLNNQMKSNVKAYKQSFKGSKAVKGAKSSTIYHDVGKTAYKEIPHYSFKRGARVASGILTGVFAGATAGAAIAGVAGAAGMAAWGGAAAGKAYLAAVGISTASSAGSHEIDRRIRKTISEKTM